MAANDVLFDAQLKHAIGIRQLSAGEVQRAQALLTKAERELIDLLAKRLKQNMTTARLKLLLKDVRALRTEMWRAFSSGNKGDLLELARAEQLFAKNMMDQALPFNLDFAGVDAGQLRHIVTAQPFAGGANAARTLSQWHAGLAAADSRRIQESIQMGMIQGETVDQMVSRVRQTLPLTRANATAVVRTGINHVVNASQNAFHEANADLIQAIRWTSTLDGRTSLICAGRDGHFAPVTGKSTKGIPRPWLSPLTARPPAHPNCRSITVAVLDAEGLDEVLPNRPFVMDARTPRRREIDFRKDAKAQVGAKQWKLMTPRERNAQIAGVRRQWTQAHVGTVPGKVTYDEWLRKQSSSFQDEVLGKGKGKLFRDGMKIDKYTTRSGRELTLGQLQATL